MTAAPQTKLGVVCPACGHFVHHLILETGFCRPCTNEARRGGPLEPKDRFSRT